MGPETHEGRIGLVALVERSHTEMIEKIALREMTDSSLGNPKGRNPIAQLADRTVVFISHSNPEDNAITAWYGARLSAAGYTVWTDLTRLLGGEEMWLDIDDALRFHARKVIALLSRAAVDPAKEGVRAELDRAHTYRKSLGDRRFIIPVKIDDVPFDELPPTISNRTIIEAHDNQAAALARIIKSLEEDDVPRSATPSADALFRWQRAFAPENQAVESVEDSLVSNWFPILSLPKTIHLYEIRRPLNNVATEPATIAKNHPLPMVAHWRRLLSFAQWDEVQKPIADATPVKLDLSMSLDNFMAGGNADVSLGRGEAGKMLKNLLRQAFDGMAEHKGLRPYSLSERKIAWWTPNELVEDNRARFTRVSGLTGWRKLSGIYSARGRNWHFGVTAVPMLGDPFRLRLTPHTVYTDPTGEKAPTADFRRAHCKLWFNSKWRDLLYGLVTYLADEDGRIRLPFGCNTHGIVAASPIAVTLPVRPSAALEATSSPTAEPEGDTVDLDMSDYANDPAFEALIEDEEPEEPPVDGDAEDGEDEA